MPLYNPPKRFSGYAFNYLYPGGQPHFTSNVAPIANTLYAHRLEIPNTGTISDIAVLIGGTSSGNMDAAILTFDGTTYTRAWSKGSTATPAGNTWTSLGNPGIAVVAGDIIFVGLAWDNATATPARLVPLGAGGWHGLAGPTYPKFAWSKATSFAIPATVADSGVTTGAQVFAYQLKVS